MTADQLIALRKRLEMTQTGMARLCGVSQTYWRMLESRTRPIPISLIAWLEELAEWLEWNPPPREHERKSFHLLTQNDPTPRSRASTRPK
jgi:transcriptional regulator with XRE-family HTH domain